MICIQILFELFQQYLSLLDIFASSDITSTIIVIIIVFAVIALIQASSRSIKDVHSHWHHMFETIPFSPGEFYEMLERDISEKGIAGISFSKIKHSEGGIISANRIYLRVKYKEYMMDICAAPFAKQEFFVSWWLGGDGFTLRDFLMNIPIIGGLFKRREKTFYEQDTEIMFKETVALCVKNTITSLVEVKGSRQIDIYDWKGSNLQFKNN